ncbi:MAG: hypothetical protein VKJ66_04975 [Synechococcus sp.]|nr:hypothetical protein [Synechococcus sp.]
MNDYQLGAALRERVLQARAQQLPVDGRRLQGLVGDLCGAEQGALLPALRHLVLSAGFHSGAGQTPPLADPRLAPRLMAELEEVFAAPICRRMEAVVRGLLALPAAPVAPAEPSPPPVAAAPPMPAATASEPELEPEPIAAPLYVPVAPEAAPSRGGRGLVALLAFLTGSLSVALVGLVLWMRQAQLTPDPLLPLETPAARTPSPSQTPPTAPSPEPPAVPQLPEATPTDSEAAVAQAISSVQALYAALGRQEFEQARQFFAGQAADQFDPAFFEQFQRVEVSNLESRGSNGTSVTLQGVLTFVYPDGSSQSETRTFTVDTATSPALITGSAFGQVLQPRS